MDFIDIAKFVVSALMGLISTAVTLGFIFLIWGVFRGFDWDLYVFLTGIGKIVGVIFLACYGIWFVTKRRNNNDANY